MKIIAIVPQWNRSDLLRSLLANLAQQTRPFDEWLVVDNGSTDDSVTVARAAGARVIEMGRNAGFAAAVNRGIEACDAEWVAVLNNDVQLDANWLSAMTPFLDRADILCGKLYSAARPELLDGTFDELAASACALRCGAGKPDGPLWLQSREIHIAPMTAALFRHSVFEQVGRLDELFESYLEDVDFGLRCALAGKRTFFVPQATGTHQGSATSGAWHYNTIRLLSRNQMLLSLKHFVGQPLWPQLAGQLLWGLVALRHGGFIAWCKGKWQAWTLRKRVVCTRHPQLGAFLETSERNILEIQRQSGFDLYWRLYFWLRGR